MFSTDHASKPTLQKRDLLYAQLQFHRPNRYLKRVKGFGSAFSKGNEAARIAPTDLSRQFRTASKLRQDIDTWVQKNSQPKVQKTAALPPPPVKHSTPAPRRVERVLSKSSLKYSNRSNYRVKPLQKPVKAGSLDALAVKPITLQELSAMNYGGQLADFFEMDEETDQYLKKLHTVAKKPQDLSYVLRMQDNKVNRGLRALHRHQHY